MASHSGEIVKAALEAKKMTQIELAKRIGRDQTLISRYISGQIEISEKAARSIAEILGIDFEQLHHQLQRDKLERKLGRLETEFGNVIEENRITDAASHDKQVFVVGGVSVVGDTAVVKTVPMLTSISSRKQSEERYVVPAGIDIDFEKAFALKISEPSMTDNEIGEGDIIVVDPGTAVKNGDRVLIKLGENCKLRRIYQTDKTIMLQSSADRDEPVIFLSQDKDDFEIVGRVVLCVKYFA